MEISKDGDDPYDVYFDQDGLMQVEDILIKISSNEKFLYIIKEQNLDPELYNKLISEIYDELKMDKINVDRLEESFDLLGMVDYTPFGINEPEITNEDKRPMFGSQGHTYTVTDPAFYNTQTGGCQQCTNTYSYTTTYIFWIGFNSSPEFTGQTCASVPSCK